MEIFKEIEDITNLAKSLANSLMLASANNEKASSNVTLAYIVSEKLDNLQKEILK